MNLTDFSGFVIVSFFSAFTVFCSTGAKAVDDGASAPEELKEEEEEDEEGEGEEEKEAISALDTPPNGASHDCQNFFSCSAGFCAPASASACAPASGFASGVAYPTSTSLLGPRVEDRVVDNLVCLSSGLDVVVAEEQEEEEGEEGEVKVDLGSPSAMRFLLPLALVLSLPLPLDISPTILGEYIAATPDEGPSELVRGEGEASRISSSLYWFVDISAAFPSLWCGASGREMSVRSGCFCRDIPLGGNVLSSKFVFATCPAIQVDCFYASRLAEGRVSRGLLGSLRTGTVRIVG